MKAAIKELATKPEEEDEDYEQRMERWADRPHLSIISDQLKLNIGMIFTNKDLNQIKDILDANSREAPARVGSIAPDSVIQQKCVGRSCEQFEPGRVPSVLGRGGRQRDVS